jgi:MoaA/NifB/PqqE/SkfB family radical SAM enzyme
MFNFNELKSVHLEITSRCQAKCPMCSRNIHGGIPNTQGFLVDWTLDEFKKICNEELITQIKKFVFTGGFGDPMVNNDFINMCQYTVDINPEIDILAHTNGGLRKEEWWQELAKSMPKKHAVTFALDGLEDTHHLYRIGTTYEKVIRNAKAFINAGGRADWQFIRFKHNEHQVEEAIKRAKDLGFVSFTLRETTRFTGNEKFEVYDNTGKITHYLEIPTDNIMKNIDDEIVILVDAFDVLLNKPLNNIEEDFKKHECKLLISGEANCFPFKEYESFLSSKSNK